MRRVMKSSVKFAAGSDMCWWYPGKTRGQASVADLLNLRAAGMPTLDVVRAITLMNDSTNWQSLFSHFDYEKALSGYIATYPHHLEDGLTQHPSERIRERVFKDRSRSDVILLDRNERPVIVECKQGQPAVSDIKQLRGYLHNLRDEKGHEARAILVHGGARKLRTEVAHAAAENPKVEIVQHRLQVEFLRCN